MMNGDNKDNDVKSIKDKYLELIDELDNDNKLGTKTSLNPDQQLENDEILQHR